MAQEMAPQTAASEGAAGARPVALAAGARLPGSAWAQGAGLALALLALELLASLATAPAARLEFAWFRALSLPLLSGYMFGATRGIAAAGRRALGELEPLLEHGAADRERHARRLGRASVGVHAACLAFGLGLPLAVGLALPDLRRAALSAHPQILAFWAMASLFWWLLAQGVALVVSQARVFQEIGRRAVRIDLFRPSPVAAFGRVGVRSALFVCGGLALAVLLAATPGSQGSWLPRLEIARGVGALAAILVASGACALVALLLPLLGIRERIRAEKAQVVARLEEALPAHTAEARHVLEGGTPRAPGLLALRDRIQEAAEWPLDTAMRRRFGLYALLPATSWLVKALVERGVEALLG